MCKSYFEPSVKLQKKVFRIISYLGFNSNVEDAFKKLEIMQIKQIHVDKVALVTYKVKDLSPPAALRDLFWDNKSVHDYDTRQRENFHVPQAKRKYLRRSISCKGVSIWNRIIQYVTFDCSFLSFRYVLLEHVLSDESIYTKWKLAWIITCNAEYSSICFFFLTWSHSKLHVCSFRWERDNLNFVARVKPLVIEQPPGVLFDLLCR